MVTYGDRILQTQREKEKLNSSYENNKRHIEWQIEKIRKAEKIKRKYELQLQENIDDMKIVRDTIAGVFNILDMRNIQYSHEKKEEYLSNTTFPDITDF